MPRALVTGGAGFIGRHVVHELLADGWQVTVLDDLSMGRAEHVPPAATLVIGDVRAPQQVAEAARGADVILHLAAVVSVRASVQHFYRDAEVNLMGTLNVLRAAVKQGAERVIFASSMAVYADSPAPVPIDETYTTAPFSPYGIAKLAGEQYTLLLGRQLGFDGVVLRYFNTYGPGQTFTPYVGVITIFVHRLLAGQPPVIFGDGEQKRDFVHVRDVARATKLALQAPPGEVFNVGTGRATSVNQIARMLIERLAPHVQPEYAPPQPGELRYSIADINKARRLLGYEPAYRLEESLDEVIASCRAQVSRANAERASAG